MSNDAPGAGEPIEINSCDDVLSHVFEFLDHETDDERRAVIAEHLEDCSSCLREFGIEHTTLQVDHVGDHAAEGPRLQFLPRIEKRHTR